MKNRRALSAAKCPSPRDAPPRGAPVTNADGRAGGRLIKPAARGPATPSWSGSLIFQLRFKVNILGFPVFFLPQEVDGAHSTLKGSGPSPQILQLSLGKGFF